MPIGAPLGAAIADATNLRIPFIVDGLVDGLGMMAATAVALPHLTREKPPLVR